MTDEKLLQLNRLREEIRQYEDTLKAIVDFRPTQGHLPIVSIQFRTNTGLGVPKEIEEMFTKTEETVKIKISKIIEKELTKKYRQYKRL